MAESTTMGKLKSLGKGLGSLIFEESSEEDAAQMKQVEATSQVSPQSRIVVATQVSENDLAYAELCGAVMERDTPYTRFLKTVKSLEKVSMDTTARYVAAREVLNGNGVSPDQILQAINHHVSVLEAKKGEFAQTVQNKEDTSLKALEYECVHIDQANESARAEVVQLQEAIAEREKNKISLQTEISNQRAKIKAVVDGFLAAAAMLAQKLESDRAKISSLGA